MRPRRAIRTLLVFVLLGAVATVFTSWAIHAVRFSRASPGPLFVPSPTTRTSQIARVPRLPWPVDGGRIAEYGIDVSARPGQPVFNPGHGFGRWLAEQHPGAVLTEPSLRDADRSWRRHRTLESGMPPTPHYPFPFALSEDTNSRAGWRVLASLAEITSDTELPPRHASYEALAIIRAGWPRPALESGAHYAELVEDLSYEKAPRLIHSEHASRAVLARPPKVSLLGGVELWHASVPSRSQSRLWQTPHDPLDRFALPLRPLWPGFLINTFFYAILTFALVRGPRVLRRARRRRRGRCERCGYDRAGLDAGAACPECGAGAPARRSRAEVA